MGCGTPDKGDIYTLTLDQWSERRGRQLGSFTFSTGDNPQLLDYFCVCVLENFGVEKKGGGGGLV